MVKFIKKLFLLVMCCASVSASELSSGSSSGHLLGTASTASVKSEHSSSSSDTSSGSTVFVKDSAIIADANKATNFEINKNTLIDVSRGMLRFQNSIVQRAQEINTAQATPATPPPPPTDTTTTTTTTTLTTTVTPPNELVGGSPFEKIDANEETVFYTTDGKERREPSIAQVVKRSFFSTIAAAGTQAALSAWKAKEDVGIRVSGAASTVLPQMCNGAFSTKDRSARTKRHQMETTIEELLAMFAEKPNKQTSANPHHALLVAAAFILENREMRINEQTRDALVTHFQEVARTTTDVAQKLSGVEAITEL